MENFDIWGWASNRRQTSWKSLHRDTRLSSRIWNDCELRQRKTGEKKKLPSSGLGVRFLQPNVNTCFSDWGTPYIHKHTGSWHRSLKVQLGWAQVTDSDLALWEPLDASLPSTLSRIHVVKFLAFAPTLKTNTRTELQPTQKQQGEQDWMTLYFYHWKNTLDSEGRNILNVWSPWFSESGREQNKTNFPIEFAEMFNDAVAKKNLHEGCSDSKTTSCSPFCTKHTYRPEA